jgi:hypothetical protein
MTLFIMGLLLCAMLVLDNSARKLSRQLTMPLSILSRNIGARCRDRRDAVPCGMPRSAGCRARRDAVPCGMPCRAGCRAVRDTVPCGIPSQQQRDAPATSDGVPLTHCEIATVGRPRVADGDVEHPAALALAHRRDPPAASARATDACVRAFVRRLSRRRLPRGQRAHADGMAACALTACTAIVSRAWRAQVSFIRLKHSLVSFSQ